MVQIPSDCEVGCADVVNADDWAFLPAFQKEKKERLDMSHQICLQYVISLK